MKKTFLYLLFVFVTGIVFAQKDLITLNDGVELKCDITKIDSVNIYFNIPTRNQWVPSFIDRTKVMNVSYDFQKATKPISSERKPLQSPFLNVSLGFGPSHGGVLGIQSIVGQKNSGFILALGMSPQGQISPAIGVQLAINWFFANFGYGSIGVHKYGNDPYTLDKGIFYNIGAMINLGKQKKWYLEIGLGNTVRNKSEENNTYRDFEKFEYKGSLGIGFRIGK